MGQALLWHHKSEQALGYWSVGTHFLRLAEGACKELASSENAWVVTSKDTISSENYAEATRWSDHSVGIAVLFNFFHGIELLLKGFIGLKETVPRHHKLTALYTIFEKHYGQSDLASLINTLVRSIKPSSPLGQFFSDNGITIDKWYEALKYPESMDGQTFSHFALKYGGVETVSFWSEIGKAAMNLRLQAVALSREGGGA